MDKNHLIIIALCVAFTLAITVSIIFCRLHKSLCKKLEDAERAFQIERQRRDIVEKKLKEKK